MAKNKADVAAAKAKKQKIILVVAGVLLLGVAAIQVPKLMKGSSSAAPKAAAQPTPVTPVPSGGVTPAGGAATGVKISGPHQTAVLAGVSIETGGSATADEGQLVSFSLFDAKDPFVQQNGDATAGSQATTSTSSSTGTTSSSSGGTSAGGNGSGAVAALKPEPIRYATILLDGKSQQLELKQKFPKSGPLFVLVALKSKEAKIGVAGGTFDDGKTVSLVQGKKLTLADTATGVRYQLKLVYTGSAPEVIQSFSSGSGQASSGNGQAATATAGVSTAAAARGATTTTATP